MSNHTKGPWSQDKYGAVKTSDGRTLVTEGVALSGKSTNETRANARLIAAAPELLEALQELIDMDVAYRRGAKVEEAVEKARAAIEKATKTNQNGL